MSGREIIDVWMQHPTKRHLEHPAFESLRRWMGVGGIPDEIPLEMTVASMDGGGVSRGLIAAWYGPSGDLISNDEVAEACKAYPGRFHGLASGNLYKPMDAVRDLRRMVKEHGFKGLRIVPWLWNLPPNDRRYYPLFAECCELGVPFCTQIGHTGPLCPSEPGRPIPYLDDVCLEFPELKIVAGHVGYPWLDEAISLARKYPNFYIDTSAYKVTRYPEGLVEYMRANGSKKVLFGTNFPMIPHGDALADFDSLGLDAEAETRFLSGNAKAVFGLE